jgi:hypothetical protein
VNRRAAFQALLPGLLIAILAHYLIELALRTSRPDPGLKAIERAEALGRPFDHRSRREVVRALRASGIDAVPRLVPAALREATPQGEFRSGISFEGREMLPLAGPSQRTTVLCNEAGEYAIFESDEHGFRNPLGIWDSAPVELLLLGDSFTIGECVGTGESLGDRLRSQVPDTINLGYSGHSPLFELATLVEYGPRLRPRTTLWFYFENDLAWFDIGKDRNTPLLMRYLEPDFRQGLIAIQPEIDASLRSRIEASLAQGEDSGPAERLSKARRSAIRRIADFLRLTKLRSEIGWLRRAHSPSREAPPDFELFAEILTRATATVESWEGELVLVYLPGVWNFEKRPRVPRWRPADMPERVKQVGTSLGLRLIDVESAMRAHDDPLSLFSYRGLSVLGSPHLNAEGYAFIAGVVAKRLEP